MVRKTEVTIAEGLRGGKGQVEFHHIVSKDELNGHGSMYAMGILKPGCSVGYHQHTENTEPYFILKASLQMTTDPGRKWDREMCAILR